MDKIEFKQKKIFVSMLRAGSIGDDQVPIVQIDIKKDIDVSKMTLGECKDLYTSQGKDLAESLLASLPGGTMDALLCNLLEHKRSLFMVPHFIQKAIEEEESKND